MALIFNKLLSEKLLDYNSAGEKQEVGFFCGTALFIQVFA